jgi:lipopolysaccharide transport system ATP-binding protein
MSETIITVENLSKRYVIGHQRGKDDGLRHAIERALRAPLNWVRHGMRAKGAEHKEFWALRDVNLEIKQGEVVGIIGRNGAGKSTLLKILSRITEPTKGRIRIKGRVASLLEVGTGFHQELTGRENIFLNGAILGMTHAEIKRKFDEIVAFAEVERFLDTPVKRYSSGMYVRLAFAVAAHLEPEILVVDEVLAVGDTEFQNKCLGKMSEVAHGGRTVLFVSHNMASLSRLCTRGIFLDEGRKVSEGTISDAVERYLRTAQQEHSGHYKCVRNQKQVQVVEVNIISLEKSGIHVSGTPLRIRVTIHSENRVRQGCLAVQISNYMNTPVLHLQPYDQGVFWGSRPGLSILECEVPECWLNVGPHHLTLYVADPPGGEHYETLQGVCPFHVEVHHAATWWGWNRDSCCYITQEKWANVPHEAELATAVGSLRMS